MALGCRAHRAWTTEGDLVTTRDLTVLRSSQILEADERTWWPLERDPYPLESSQPGVFIAGDVRHESIKRVASAVGDGAMAVQLIHAYLASPQPTVSGAPPPAEQNILALAEQSDNG